jgi:hypothetical protein
MDNRNIPAISRIREMDESQRKDPLVNIGYQIFFMDTGFMVL